ncbi:hypothetical protein [Gottfriedia solisilvae]|uniref:hypothetical protein n=1 Tax=Gottfriedia solisilvae TaxID=1516104 RepID=UPI003D2F3FF5
MDYLKKYSDLPISIPSDKLDLLFIEIIEAYNFKKIDKYYFFEALSELNDRQTYTHKLLKNEIRKGIDSILCNLWNTDNLDEVDNITYFIISFGLEKCFELAKESLIQNKHMDKKIRKVIEETIEEIGGNLLNPFHDW